ncbi:hypothetical protein [Streptomyces sp. NPDC046197]
MADHPLRQQFEGVIWRFKTGGQWRETPQEFEQLPTTRREAVDAAAT